MLKQTAANLEYLELSSSSVTAVSEHKLAMALVISFPVLQLLKLMLDNITFTVIARWKMPHLRNVSIVSSDLSYAGWGFALFFVVHRKKIH